jgi:WD40 repeat protein/mono/diheme cytochrome c family protein
VAGVSECDVTQATSTAFRALTLVPGALVVIVLCASILAAQQARSVPDYARDVVPILEANCVRCHSPAQQEGGFMLDAYEDLIRGGDAGEVIAPGNAEKSPLVAMIEGRAKKKMPPKGELKPDEIATLRAWIDAGAQYSEMPIPSLDERVPALAAAASVRAPVTGLAFRPDGQELAIGGYRQVRRMLLTNDSPPLPLAGLHDLVRAVAYSPDGSWIAAAGGVPGSFGEIAILDGRSDKPRRTLYGHRDYVYQVAISHDGKRLASCGYDKSIRVWDVESGRTLSVLREHTDAVFAVAFSSDDAWVASGAGDRSVKVWDAQKGVRLYTLSDATDVVTTVQFRPAPALELTAAGNDKTIRTWAVTADAGRQTRTVLAHTAPILAIRYSPDGKLLASASADRTVKIWNADTLTELRALERQPDWPQALAWSPDGRTLAVGRYDGSVALYDAATGRRVERTRGATTMSPRWHIQSRRDAGNAVPIGSRLQPSRGTAGRSRGHDARSRLTTREHR